MPLCFPHSIFSRNADYALPRQTADCGMCTPAAVFRRSTKIFLGHDMFISFITWFVLSVNTLKFRMTRSSLSPHCLFAASRRYVNNFGPCFEMHTQVPQVNVSGKLQRSLTLSWRMLRANWRWIKLDYFLSSLTPTAIIFLQKFIDVFIGTLRITANIKYFHRMIFIWDFIIYMIYTVSARLQSYEQINFDLLNH